ncbi:MAG: IMP cyclohydrolase [Planctomycetes bacterium]|nr:IMP cyclohydrolase [Planctomycetota bacterium]
MYVGRIVAVGRTKGGRVAGLYRVSSRSFPNRKAIVEKTKAIVVPKEGSEGTVLENAFITYDCARIVGKTAVVTNGSHTNPIAEKIASGMPIRDALALSLLALDYEHDSLDTPRIAAVIERGAESGWLGVVRKDGIEVREVPLGKGEACYLATYEISTIDPNRKDKFDVPSAKAGAKHIINGGVFADLEKPVVAVCAFEKKGGFELADAMTA